MKTHFSFDAFFFSSFSVSCFELMVDADLNPRCEQLLRIYEDRGRTDVRMYRVKKIFLEIDGIVEIGNTFA